jgi:hypothetical protein
MAESVVLDRKTLVIPTATNILNLINENIITNMLRRQDSDLELLSLYRLAHMIHYNEGEYLVVQKQTEET